MILLCAYCAGSGAIDEGGMTGMIRCPDCAGSGSLRHQVYTSDALAWLKTLPDNSADSAVLDPPSGIGFMGKDWDSEKGGASKWIAWLAEILAELLRVLKPGAHICVWAIPRTSHWTGTAVERAGFEVRDCLTHLFGSGFPKSHNISKAMDKFRDIDADREDIDAWRSWLIEACGAAKVEAKHLDEAFEFNGMGCHWTTHPTQPSVPTLWQLPTLLGVLGLDELPEEQRERFLRLNNAKGQPGDAWFKREVIGTKRVKDIKAGSFYSPGEGSYVLHDVDETASATDLAKEWEGWGTALKPGAEFWWLGRKPLEDTIARNVMIHGTGGLNIAGCRVGSSKRVPSSLSTKGQHGWGTGSADNPGKDPEVGRYPPNVLMTHDPDCDDEACAPWCPIEMLDEQSGEQRDGVAVKRNLPDEGARNGLNLQVPVTQRGPDEGYGAGGGASRFYPRFLYCPKPSRAEREAGLDAFPLKSAKKFNEGGIQGRRDAKAEAAIADAEIHSQGLDGRGRTLIREDGTKTLVARFIPQHRANIHPTVKPVKFMRWLVRLVTPPGGIVLDPFTGSGTTGIAAMLEGARFAGSEMSEEYARIARARIAHAAGEQVELTPLGTAAPPEKPGAPDPQLSLFG